MLKKFWLMFVPMMLLLFLPLAYGYTNSIKADSVSVNILFIGNSYTYYHSMPQLVKAMTESRFPNREVNISFIGRGGINLKQQWEEGEALDQIQTGKWDYVVLQEQSMLGDEIIENGKSFVRSPDLFFEYARKFVDQIQQYGAKPVFYMTWAREDRPDQQKYLTYAYMTIAKETGSLIAPVGIIWDSLRTNKTFDLYEFDGSHPSVYGSYTAAVTIFSVLFDANPIGLSGRLQGYEILRGGKISDTESLLCDLVKSNVKIIQQEVSCVSERMKTNGGYLDVKKAVSNKIPSKLSIFFNYASSLEGQVMMLLIILAGSILLKGYFFLIKS